MKWRDNNLRRRLGREPLAAFWMAMGSTTIVELAGAAAPDAFIIDMQHGLWDRATLEAAVGTVPADASVLVRVAENSAVAIGQALDTGAEGVIVPLVESAEEAAQAVAAARFPPLGRRSGGGVRPLAAGFMDYCAGADERTVVGVMIETARGVDNATAIAGTAGVDFVLIGTGDLTLSLARDDAHPHRCEEACRAVREACGKAGISCAIFTTGAEQAAARAAEGYDMVVPANDIGVVAQGFAAAMQAFRKEASGKNEG